MAVVLAFSGCRKQQAHQVDQPQRAKLVQGAKLISVLNPQHADSLVLMAYKQGDYQRMLTLADSLSARGELNELRTRGYRATAYRGMKDMKAAIASHTKDILNALKEKGIKPKWVQVGNETNNGMIFDSFIFIAC